MLVSCSGKKTPVNISLHTDLTHITGITAFEDAVYCATKGGLVKWELPEGRYTVYTTLDGLPSNILSDVVVDGEGMMWIGSDSGITSFDGMYFENYDRSDGLPSTEINELAVDNGGNLWIATNSGVASFERGRFKYLDDEEGPGSNPVLCINFDLGNNIWVGTGDDGIYFTTEGVWKHTTTRDGLLANTSHRIAQAWDRSVWGASWAGISRWDGKGWQTFSSLKRLGTYLARDIITSENRFWYFTDNGTYASQGTDWFNFTEKEGLISNDVTCGYVVNDEKVYVGTVDGMSVIENGVIENYFVPNSPVGYNCISITIDDRDRIWLGTWETGLNIYDSGYWTQLIGKNIKTLETVRSVVFGPDNVIVFNTMNGIAFENENEWIVETRRNGVSENDVRCGVYDKKGRYWAGTASGICCRDKGRWKRFRSIHGLPSEDTWACSVADDGTVWFGTAKGIVSFNDYELTDRTPETGLEDIDVRSIAVDGDRVLFGTNDGKLIEYNNGAWDVYGKNYLGTDKGIYSIAFSPAGAIWLGTNGDGIIGIENGEKAHYTIADGLPSNYVCALVFGKNTLWAACYGGTASIEMERIEK